MQDYEHLSRVEEAMIKKSGDLVLGDVHFARHRERERELSSNDGFVQCEIQVFEINTHKPVAFNK